MTDGIAAWEVEFLEILSPRGGTIVICVSYRTWMSVFLSPASRE